MYQAYSNFQSGWGGEGVGKIPYRGGGIDTFWNNAIYHKILFALLYNLQWSASFSARSRAILLAFRLLGIRRKKTNLQNCIENNLEFTVCQSLKISTIKAKF